MNDPLSTHNLLNETESPSDMLRARAVALSMLNLILTRRNPMDQVMDEHDGLHGLPPRDRAFVRMMVATTLRTLGQIDDIVLRATERRDPPEPPALNNLLRMGIAQILFMNVPDHAAVNTSVDLATTSGLSRQKGLVNAVLRRVTRDGRDWIAGQDAARINTPVWLMQAWINDYGLRAAAEIAHAGLAEASLDITLKDPAHAAHWASVLEAVALPTGTLRRNAGGSVSELSGFDDGLWWVQDAAAALPATLFGDVAGKIVIDLCAAPGGKTAQLAAAGAYVVAIDRSIKRLQRLQDNMRRLRLDSTVTVEAADASLWQPREPAMHILLDAPCSATGTIRRHPDVPHLKTPDDIARLMVLQAQMLDNASRMLAPGGTLVYCTCSLQKSEGEGQIDSFLARTTVKMARKPILAEEIGGLSDALTPQGDVRILPYHMAAHGGMDGFFIARLMRL